MVWSVPASTVGLLASRTNVISFVALFHALSTTVNLITNVPSVSEAIVVATALDDQNVIVPVHDTLVHA